MTAVIVILGLGAGCLRAEEKSPVGYDDTPFLPGGKWRVHDINRPQPPVVAPKPFTPAPPPAGAIVLFDGKDLSKWGGTQEIKKDGKVVERRPREARWKIENGYMEVNKTGSIYTQDKFGSCKLHVEWASPVEVKGNSQGRGNSGIFLMDRYEVQVLDAYNNRTYADGGAGSIYGQTPPLANPCRPPGEWNSYDITFEAPAFTDGKLEKPAYVTLVFNGVLVQDHTELLGATAHKRVATYSPHGDKERLSLQDHGNPVRYRNIWLVPRDE